MGGKKKEKVLWKRQVPNVYITNKDLYCAICVVQCGDDDEYRNHVQRKTHRANTLKTWLKVNSEELIEDKFGIVITCVEITHDKIIHEEITYMSKEINLNKEDLNSIDINVPVNEQRIYHFRVENALGNRAIKFVECEFLHALKVATLNDELGNGFGLTKEGHLKRYIQLEPGAAHHIQVILQSKFVNLYKIPLSFQFLIPSTTTVFFIIRYLNIHFYSSKMEFIEPNSLYKRQRKNYAIRYNSNVVFAEKIIYNPANNQLHPEIELDEYPVPKDLLELVKRNAFTSESNTRNLPPIQLQLYASIQNMFDDDLHEENYADYLEILLYLEEIQLEADIATYDMQSAKLYVDPKNKKLLCLKVPGLSENRPSVLKGDKIFAYINNSADDERDIYFKQKPVTEYEGIVQAVYENSIGVIFHPKFHELFIPNMRFHIRFTFSRRPLRLMHRAVEMTKLGAVDNLGYQCILFPTVEMVSVPRNNNQDTLLLFNIKIEKNIEQKRAIEHIVLGSCRPIPYILFGPPGTGKTVTLAEAIKQIWKRIKDSHILVCAASNSACDTITRRLLEHIPARDIFRMHAMSRDPAKLHEKIKACSNYSSRLKSYYYPSKKDLMNYRIIVTTLVSCGRMVSAAFPRNHFSHIIIDEAGQSMEPESMIAIIGIMHGDYNKDKSCQLVLAGDPKQLGPVVRSDIASGRTHCLNSNLMTSYLERLMETCDVYKKDNHGQYNYNMITKLVKNYRSHPSILKLPNEMFYEGELEPCADQLLIESLCRWENLPKQNFPLIFHGVIGRDIQEAHSPSYFNPEEVFTVYEYVNSLMKTKRNGIRITADDIGIISPYRKQVHKIKQFLDKHGYGHITVGSTEEFQGQERRIIIISTVRSTNDLLALDFEFQLGFLRNEKRFNVAVTRAKALLIIIGNPYILAKDEQWGSMLEYCCHNGAYKGCDYEGVEATAEDIIFRLEKLVDEEDEHFIMNYMSVSHKEEQEEPRWKSDY